MVVNKILLISYEVNAKDVIGFKNRSAFTFRLVSRCTMSSKVGFSLICCSTHLSMKEYPTNNATMEMCPKNVTTDSKYRTSAAYTANTSVLTHTSSPVQVNTLSTLSAMIKYGYARTNTLETVTGVDDSNGELCGSGSPPILSASDEERPVNEALVSPSSSAIDTLDIGSTVRENGLPIN